MNEQLDGLVDGAGSAQRDDLVGHFGEDFPKAYRSTHSTSPTHRNGHRIAACVADRVDLELLAQMEEQLILLLGQLLHLGRRIGLFMHHAAQISL